MSITRISQEPEARPTTSPKLTDAATAVSVEKESKDTAQGSKDQPSLEGELASEGDGMQVKSENATENI